MSGADLFGLIVSALICAYLIYALLRGETLLMAQGWLQIAVFVVVVIALTRPLGAYMARVFRNERVFLTPVLGGAERLTYRILRVDPRRDQDWKSYAGSLILFSGSVLAGAVFDPAHPGHPSLQSRRALTPAPGT